ncbi:MAG: hypothetical protein ACOC5T_04520 [Elusimicrobiota bacterium]
MKEEIYLHGEGTDYAKELNKVFPVSRAIRILRTWKKDDRTYWTKILVATIIHNACNTKKEKLKIIKELKELTNEVEG